MNLRFPASLRELPVQGLYVLATVGNFLLFALLYQPRLMMELLSTGTGFYQMANMQEFNTLICCGIIAVSMLLLRTLFFLFRKTLAATLERFGIWCVFEVLVTAAFMALYFTLIGKNTLDTGSYFQYYAESITSYFWIALFPYVILTLAIMNHDLRNSETVEEDARVRFYDNRHLLKFSTRASAIIYIEAEENYIVVHYVDEGAARKAQIRNTMKSLESICGTGNLVRVHRSYIVNPKHVKQVRKAPDGYFFADMDNESASIPVSKRYLKMIDSIL